MSKVCNPSYSEREIQIIMGSTGVKSKTPYLKNN
jgi:hypothetical protein